MATDSLRQFSELTPLLSNQETDGSTETQSPPPATPEEEIDGPKGSKWRIFSKLVSRFGPHKWKILVAVLAIFSKSSLSAFQPFMFGKIVDNASTDFSAAQFWLFLYFLIGLFNTVMNAVQSYISMWTTAKVAQTLREDLLHAILHMETGYFDTVTSGELSARISNDANQVTQRLLWTMRSSGNTIFSITATVIFALCMNVKLTLASFVCIPLVFLSSSYFGNKLYGLSRKQTDLNAAAFKVAQDAIGNVRTVKQFGGETYEVNDFSKQLLALFNLQATRALIVSIFWSTYVLFPSIGASIVLFYGVLLIRDGELTLGELATFMLYQDTIMNRLNSFGNQWTQLVSALGSAEKIFNILEREPLVKPLDSYRPSKAYGKIELSNVTFAYPKEPEVIRLHDINLSVHPGQVVALVGPSGGGKSTILKLIKHLYEPNKGSVTFDGMPVSHFDPAYLHQKVAVVGQLPTLFARTIRENITYGFDVSDSEVKKAAKMAHAHEFIKSFPKKYHTEVGERGVTLSGGQRQRIAIARALVRSPAVLLLDEATASLDSESEHLVHQAIDTVMKNYTVIIVAHRLSTVRNADVICAVDNGRIVERGSHEELLKMNGLYAQLIQKQMMKGD